MQLRWIACRTSQPTRLPGVYGMLQDKPPGSDDHEKQRSSHGGEQPAAEVRQQPAAEPSPAAGAAAAAAAAAAPAPEKEEEWRQRKHADRDKALGPRLFDRAIVAAAHSQGVDAAQRKSREGRDKRTSEEEAKHRSSKRPRK